MAGGVEPAANRHAFVFLAHLHDLILRIGQQPLEPFHLGQADSGPGTLVARNNTFVNSGSGQTGGSVASIPYSYTLDASGLPRGWIARQKNALRTLAWRFNADRMVMDYTMNSYLPAAGAKSSQMR